jgi:hypothetical protein
MEIEMRRGTIQSQDTPWTWSSGAPRARAADDVERPPNPGDLFLESGIVLAIALGGAVIVDLLLAVAGIPRPL